ncbi:hypothetical protein N2E09_08145 [Leuconostoc citreum]
MSQSFAELFLHFQAKAPLHFFMTLVVEQKLNKIQKLAFNQ